MRILLIEDDKNLCETLKYQLEREGILVDACTDGLDGLHYMKEDADDYIHCKTLCVSGTSCPHPLSLPAQRSVGNRRLSDLQRHLL